MERVGLEFLRQAGAGVADFQLHPRFAPFVLQRFHFHAQPVAARGVAQGVADEVGDDLAHAVGVGADVAFCVACGEGELDLHVGGLELRLQLGQGVADQLAEVEAVLFEGQLVCLGHGEGVQVVDQTPQVLGLAQQGAKFGLVGGDDAVADRMQARLEYGQRGAQFMGDRCGGGATFGFEFFQRVDHLVEGVHHVAHFAVRAVGDRARREITLLDPLGHLHDRCEWPCDVARHPKTHGEAKRQAHQQADEQRDLFAEQHVSAPVLAVDLHGARAVFEVLCVELVELDLNGAGQRLVELVVLHAGEGPGADREQRNGAQDRGGNPQSEAYPDAVQTSGHRR